MVFGVHVLSLTLQIMHSDQGAVSTQSHTPALTDTVSYKVLREVSFMGSAVTRADSLSGTFSFRPGHVNFQV